MRFLSKLFGSKSTQAQLYAPPESDPERRADIWRQVLDQGWTLDRPDTLPPPVVSVSDFFTGNNEEGSIAPNVAGMANEPSHDTFRDVLTSIKARPNVQDVLVALDPEDDHSMWPSSSTVYILSSATEDDVREWVAPIKPDEVSEGYATGKPVRAPLLNPNVRVWYVWWD